MPNEIVETRENRARRLVDLVCVDRDQLIFLAPGKIEAIFVDGWLWHPQDGLFEIDHDECRIKFNVSLMGFGVKALIVDSQRLPKTKTMQHSRF